MDRSYPIGRGGMKFLPHGYKFFPARRSRKGKNFTHGVGILYLPTRLVRSGIPM